MAEDLKDAISENAQQPAKATVDGQTAEQHNLKDQIAADRHLSSKDAVKSPTRGLRFSKLVPPGTV